MSHRILLAEDEPDVCAAIHAYLGRRGFRISTTDSGQEALALVAALKPDLVILDLTLNDLNGEAVLRELRQKDRTTKVIVLTGQLLPEERQQQIRALDVVAYLNKPVRLPRLEAEISAAIGRGMTVPARAVETAAPPVDTSAKVHHELANLLGVIRNQCENFVLNFQEGFYRKEPPHVVVARAITILKGIIGTIDRAMETVRRLPSESRQHDSDERKG